MKYFSHSFGEVAPKYHLSGASDGYLLSSTVIPDDISGVHPLSSTIIPGHMPGVHPLSSTLIPGDGEAGRPADAIHPKIPDPEAHPLSSTVFPGDGETGGVGGTDVIHPKVTPDLEVHPLSSTVIPGDGKAGTIGGFRRGHPADAIHRKTPDPEAHPLSSTVIPGDGKAGTGAGGGHPTGVIRPRPLSTTTVPNPNVIIEDEARQHPLAVSGGSYDSPDGSSCTTHGLQTTDLSNSVTLSPSKTPNADDFCASTLTEVSLNSTLDAAAMGVGGVAMAQATEVTQTVTVESMVLTHGTNKVADTTQASVAEGVASRSTNKVADTTQASVAEGVASRSTEVQAGVEAVNALYHQNTSHHRSPSPLVTKDDICQIVRTEIEPILQVCPFFFFCCMCRA
jgi:hypothetical protein